MNEGELYNLLFVVRCTKPMFYKQNVAKICYTPKTDSKSLEIIKFKTSILECSYLFSIVCPRPEHFHNSKTSSLNEKGSKFPSLHFGHIGKNDSAILITSN